ncbi:hypothetical protein E1162_15130 [Rhodobacteraceae bacterium RKSG542]|uniref:hypothetical protein n=1 Tax=Pseudovibrio flavus TaxID=2529854 RepID=UPI0012BD0456|nr:hypothetical protein [Pseudovibrio flavus]MTI18576.1 hypothetical protein [Pseudovibrio flavus]
MYTRRAIFEGKIHEGQEEAFYQAVEERMLPIWKQMPNAQDVRLFRPENVDWDERPVFLIQEIDYPSMAAIEEAMNSPMRDQAKAAHDTILHFYEGRHYHVISKRFA